MRVTVENVLAALTVLARYGPHEHVYARGDAVTVAGCPPDRMTPGDADELRRLGWTYHEGWVLAW